MALVESEFVSSFLSKINQKPVKYAPDYEPEQDIPARLPAPSRPFELKTEEEVAQVASGEKFDITVKNLKGKSFTLTVAPTDKVEDVKRLIEKKDKEFPVATQRLVFSGKGLQDEKTLDEYGIVKGTTLHLMKKPASTQPSTTNLEKEEKPVPSALTLPTFWKEVESLLHKHFDEKESQRILKAWKGSV